jgi:hypothetical protein
MNGDQENRKCLNLLMRAFWMAIGMSVFVWLGYEDRSTRFPVLLGVLISFLLALHLGKDFLPKRAKSPKSWLYFLLTGLSAGLLAMPLAVICMLVKISLHGHVPPDFTAAQVTAVLGKTPIWAMAGALVGFSVGLIRTGKVEF